MDWWMWLVLAAVVLFFAWAAWRMRGRSGPGVDDPRQDREARMWKNSGMMPPGAG